MIWVVLALGLITAAPILMFLLASMSCSFGLIPTITAGFISLVAFSALPLPIALCTVLLTGAVLIVCRIAGCDDDADTTDTTRGSA